MDCSPPGSSVHGISQARILEWVAFSFSRGSSGPRDGTPVSCTTSRFFTAEPSGKARVCVGFSGKNTGVDCHFLLLYIYPLFFGFPSHLGHHRALSGVSCAI